MQLEWGAYRHFPYERDLAIREAAALLGGQIEVGPSGEVSSRRVDLGAAKMLTYFSAAKTEAGCASTFQSELERSASSSRSRQSTRYSVHGLHEYRGKFNPQVCGALINILGVGRGGRLLDPFCGSGTTLVEAAHRGLEAVGTDLNPLAVFIANTKLEALTTDAAHLEAGLDRIVPAAATGRIDEEDEARWAYLEAWFEGPILVQIERLRLAIESEEAPLRGFFLVVASNLLRQFSLQNPADLRIRRRPSAGLAEPVVDVFARSANEAIRKLRAAQDLLGKRIVTGRAWLRDNRFLDTEFRSAPFDAAITSPPYATALPYIDTQRLSLVWLKLLEPSRIGEVEGDLIGSREMGTIEKRAALKALEGNEGGLPEPQASYCATLQHAISPDDGFRRKAVPLLLYRYFQLMGQTFSSVLKCLKQDAPFALIVGHNHTTLGGKLFNIDTPRHLASLAEHAGWSVSEVTELQPYQRYGLHASNAVKAETLLVLRAGRLPGR